MTFPFIATVRAALTGVGKPVIDRHAARCREDAVPPEDAAQQRERFAELLGQFDTACG